MYNDVLCDIYIFFYLSVFRVSLLYQFKESRFQIITMTAIFINVQCPCSIYQQWKSKLEMEKYVKLIDNFAKFSGLSSGCRWLLDQCIRVSTSEYLIPSQHQINPSMWFPQLCFLVVITLKSAETVWKDDPFLLELFLLPSAPATETKEKHQLCSECKWCSKLYSHLNLRVICLWTHCQQRHTWQRAERAA